MSDQEITAEFEVSDLSPEPVPKPPACLALVTMGAKTDLGLVRENNEDKFDWLEPEAEETLAARGWLYAVADGMGGHSSGQIASEMALKTLLRAYFSGRYSDIRTALTAGIRAANSLVWEAGRRIPGRTGMGTTITALVLHDDQAIIGHVGDSRAYLFRDNALEQITEDHSWVAEQVRAHLLTEQEAEESPFRNIITRSIGAEEHVEPELFEVRLQAGDVFLLCSDGLTGVVSPNEMETILRNNAPSMAAWQLVDLANDKGGPDNITCLVLRIDDLVDYNSAAPHASGDQEPASPASEGVKLPASPAETRDDAGPGQIQKSPSKRSWFGRKSSP
jgi:serine/threonine protein phosphatase PrpC